ncbi:MAG: TatD family hydrolase [Minisyncoccota bacterium]
MEILKKIQASKSAGSNNQFIDVHGHIQFPVFDNDRSEVIKRAELANIKMIAVGTQVETSRRAIEISKEFPNNVWATVGFHPNHLIKDWHQDKDEQTGSTPEKFDINILRELAVDPKVVAISECGFDLFYDDTAVKIQEKAFAEQANLARELNKPLMMHCRPSKGTDNAYEYALEILKDRSFDALPKIMHFYAGSLEMAKKLVGLGFYFTFGGVITFAKSYDEIIKYLPIDRIFSETDCPYVAPQNHRGKRNEPSYVIETVQKLAELKGSDFEKLSEDLYKNSVKVFNLKP